jgi:predicted AlkP superfamily phosphohydrolase/phosphomutase
MTSPTVSYHRRGRTWSRLAGLLALCLLLPASAQAYVGPGAGFAVVGSLGILFVTFFLALFALLTWPFRAVWRTIRSRRIRARSDTKQVLILGLDGLDPQLLEKWMEEGHLPNFQKLAAEGSFHKLASSVPPISPVAWSSFATGVDASKHNIYDFLGRDLKSYLPILSSTDIRPPLRVLKLGKFEIPISKPMVRLMRKSKPFWRILGEHYVSCHVIRVPITFPPEKQPNGALLSAMCVPDLRGTQGSFTFFTTDKERAAAFEGGSIIAVEPQDGVIRSEIPGPPDPLTQAHAMLTLPIEVRVDKATQTAHFKVGKETFTLGLREFSDWICLPFKPAIGKAVKGIVRFRIIDFEPHFNLYMTPINLDPEEPAMPISSPGFYAQYLARLIGPYATLGLAEDTWALNERILDEEAFLDYTWLIHEEREKMWFNALKKNRRGLNVVVFDATDRIQHMFFRYIADGHPANAGKDTERFHTAIFDLYKKADSVLGRTMKYVDDKTVLFAISDHGFKPFRRGINLNSWLKAEGYLAAKNGRVDRYFDGMDWSKTKAYTFGLTGLYINRKGRESQGIVDDADYETVKRELIEKLSGLKDPATGETGILRVYDGDEIFRGPYRHNGPDLIVGYNVNYRASWDAAVGIADETIFEDNTKSWSGDHCMDTMVVPGIFFSNRKIKTEHPSLLDISATTLDLFGVKRPAYMAGISLFRDHDCAKRETFAQACFPAGVPSILRAEADAQKAGRDAGRKE